MTKATSIFVSRLRGLPLVDSDGSRLGKVKDVVVQLRTPPQQPRVRGLVVELTTRQRIFVPMIRVHSIGAEQIVIAGVVNLRRFTRRDFETIVGEELFDRPVRRHGDNAKWQIYDVAIAEDRAHDWLVNEVAIKEVRKRRPFQRDKGHISIVEWRDIYEESDKSSASQDTTEQMIAELEDLKPADLARELHEMSGERRREIVGALEDHLLADALEELPEDEQVALISTLDTERAANVLEEMDPDDAADLIHELPPQFAEDLLGRMDPEEAQDVRRLLTYEELSAGGMMTPEPVVLGIDATVAEALARVRDPEVTQALACMVFVCRSPLETPTGRYVGVVHFQRLLREPPSTMVAELVDTELEPLRPDAELHGVSRFFASYNLVSAPVVDENHRLLGAITVDDVLDHLLPADWRGIQLETTSRN